MRFHFAPRPLPVDSINPSDFIARSTSRTMSRLTPGQASSIGNRERRGASQDLRTHPVAFTAAATLDGADTLLELTVNHQQGTPEVVEPGFDVMLPLVPALRAGFKSVS